MKTVYVDNNATTKVAPEVLEVMLPYFSELYGNPSSMHFFGGQVEKKVNEAREKVADFLGAEPSEIVFTGCGTESDNAAILGTLDSYPEKRHLITTRVEHPAIGNVCTYLGRKGYRITELSVNREGRLDLDELKEFMKDETVLVSIMYANNETGVIFPIEEIGEILQTKGIPFHTDAVQAAGKIPLNMRKSTVDMLSISGHKLHAPKGIGVLYIRKGTKFSPFMIGGHQEKGRRGERRMSHISSVSGKPANWPRSILMRRIYGSGPSGIISRRRSWRAFQTQWSTGIGSIDFPTR